MTAKTEASQGSFAVIHLRMKCMYSRQDESHYSAHHSCVGYCLRVVWSGRTLCPITKDDITSLRGEVRLEESHERTMNKRSDCS